VVFLFATEIATEMGFTDDCYTDGLVPSVSPSVLFSPTDFIAVTDGMSPSVKLDNVVVIFLSSINMWFTFYLFKNQIQDYCQTLYKVQSDL